MTRFSFLAVIKARVMGMNAHVYVGARTPVAPGPPSGAQGLRSFSFNFSFVSMFRRPRSCRIYSFADFELGGSKLALGRFEDIEPQGSQEAPDGGSCEPLLD